RGRRIGSIGRFNRHAARGGGGLGFRHGAFFLGTLALGLGGFELLLLFLAATVLLGQIGQFAFVLFLRFLQFAQRVLALAVYHLVTRNSSTLDIRATRAHFDVDGLGAGATAAGHGDFADLAALQRDLLRRRGRGGFLLAMVAAQEIKQLGLLAIADDLVGAFELHAGLGELREELVLGRAHHVRQLPDCDIRHRVVPLVSSAPMRVAVRSRRVSTEPEPRDQGLPASCSIFASMGARAAMINAPARSSSMPSMSIRSSIAWSAKSSVVTMPRSASAYAVSSSMPSRASSSSDGAFSSRFSSTASASVSNASLARERSSSTMSSSKPSTASSSPVGT